MSDVPVLVTNWKKVTRTVISSIRVNGELVAKELQPIFFPDEPEGKQVLTLYHARADALERKVEVLQQRALKLRGERGNDESLRQELKEAVTDLRAHVMRTRALLEAFFEPAIVAQTGLIGKTPEDADALDSYATHASGKLREIAFPALDEEKEGVTFNPIRRAEQLEAGVARIRAAKGAQATDSRVEQQVMQSRDDAEKDLRYCYIGTADGFSADATQAGYPRIADRVRPTALRREGKPEPIDLEENDLAEPARKSEPHGDPEPPDPTLVTDPSSDS